MFKLLMPMLDDEHLSAVHAYLRLRILSCPNTR